MTYCDQSNQEKHPFELPELPFEKGAFEPLFSAATFDYHHGKHHNAYVVNLNKIIEENHDFAGSSLEELMERCKNDNPGIYNNAAQVWNHSFFWHSIKPNGGGAPIGNIAAEIEKDFGSYENFKKEFKNAGLTQFGSGWVWLVYNSNSMKLEIIKTSNAEAPLSDNLNPLLACDVWEHAYYIDYKNSRPDYLDNYINKMINWDFAEMHLNRARM